MGEQKQAYGRWADDPRPDPADVNSPPFYSSDIQGPVRRAPLHAPDGPLLGHVWTDDGEAAGYLPEQAAGPAGVRAGAYVWTVLSECYRRGIPASEVLDPVLYAPTYELRP